MPWTDHIGQVFESRQAIKQLFGGDIYKGIENSQIEQTVVVIADPYETKFGYRDRYLPNGGFEYFGQRARNERDPWFNNNNRKLRDHIQNGRSALLFIRGKEGFRFDGECFYDRHEQIEIETKDGTRPQIIFFLVRGEAVRQEQLEAQIAAFQAEDAEAIRQRALDAGSPNPNIRARAGNVYQRAAAVAAHVLNRAGPKCECCDLKAPFNRADGRPYLECHHIDRLADQGADDIYSVIALHPVCHRFIHYGGEPGRAKNEQLRLMMADIEPRPR